MNRSRILCIDDDVGLHATVADVLKLNGFEVLEASDGETAAKLFERGISLVLLDVNLPGENGFDIARKLRTSLPHVGIIMLTSRNDLVDRVLGLELGADDYLVKPFELRELLARIRSVLRRLETSRADPSARGDGKTVSFGGWRLNIAGRKLLSPRDEEVELTTSEFDILCALVECLGQTVDRETLYRRTKGKDWSPLDRSVDGHIANLRRKLGADSGNDMIKTVHGKGYILTAD